MEQKPESRRLERRQTFVTEEQMISSDSRGRDREAGRKVTKVDLLLCPHCLSEETLNLHRLVSCSGHNPEWFPLKI